MSGEDELGLDAIRGPATPPSTSPDRGSKRESETYRRQTPTERLNAHIDGQLADLREENKSLRRELDELKPRYAALVESRRALSASGNASATLIALGGFLLTVSGFIPDVVFRLVGVTVGGSMFAIGCWLQFRASQQARAFKHDHLEEGIEG